MEFLDFQGLTTFYNKLKEKFVQKVDGIAIDSFGNVPINALKLSSTSLSSNDVAAFRSNLHITYGATEPTTASEGDIFFKLIG